MSTIVQGGRSQTIVQQREGNVVVRDARTATVVPQHSDTSVVVEQDGNLVTQQTRSNTLQMQQGPRGLPGADGADGATAGVEDQIVDGVTNVAPSQNAVYDAFAAHVAAPDPHPVYATDEDVITTMAAHMHAPDPHVQYRKKTDILDGGNF